MSALALGQVVVFGQGHVVVLELKQEAVLDLKHEIVSALKCARVLGLGQAVALDLERAVVLDLEQPIVLGSAQTPVPIKNALCGTSKKGAAFPTDLWGLSAVGKAVVLALPFSPIPMRHTFLAKLVVA